VVANRSKRSCEDHLLAPSRGERFTFLSCPVTNVGPVNVGGDATVLDRGNAEPRSSCQENRGALVVEENEMRLAKLWA